MLNEYVNLNSPGNKKKADIRKYQVINAWA
jgi:hypothetical protein